MIDKNMILLEMFLINYNLWTTYETLTLITNTNHTM